MSETTTKECRYCNRPCAGPFCSYACQAEYRLHVGLDSLTVAGRATCPNCGQPRTWVNLRWVEGWTCPTCDNYTTCAPVGENPAPRAEGTLTVACDMKPIPDTHHDYLLAEVAAHMRKLLPGERGEWMERVLTAIPDELRALQSQLDAVWAAMPKGSEFLDPPDGGDVPLPEQVRRVVAALDEARSQLAEAQEEKRRLIQAMREALEKMPAPPDFKGVGSFHHPAIRRNYEAACATFVGELRARLAAHPQDHPTQRTEAPE